MLMPILTFSVEKADSALYQGLTLKLDIAYPVFEAARSQGKIQDYEAAVSVDLMHRYFPTAEVGYAQADLSAQSGSFRGKGAFLRLGVDLSALKKKRSDNMLLVGVRLGTALQGCSTKDVWLGNGYWGYNYVDYVGRVRADLWGEVAAGVQVKVYKNFNMGWYVRYKILFTRGKTGALTAYYIPGFGYKDDTSFSFNYYLGWKL